MSRTHDIIALRRIVSAQGDCGESFLDDDCVILKPSGEVLDVVAVKIDDGELFVTAMNLDTYEPETIDIESFSDKEIDTIICKIII